MPMSEVTIRLLTAADKEKYYKRIEKAIQLGGTNGAPPFTPMGRATVYNEERREREMAGLSLPLTTIGWRRIWGLFEGGEMIGSLCLASYPALSQNHRTLMSMGIVHQKHRGCGYGTLMMQTAIEFAQQSPVLKWMDLQVFDDNPAAMRLYEKFGFKQWGFLDDYFIIEGQSYNQIFMTLKVG